MMIDNLKKYILLIVIIFIFCIFIFAFVGFCKEAFSIYKNSNECNCNCQFDCQYYNKIIP